MTASHIRLLGFVALAAVLAAGATARGQESFAKPADDVNKKMVKLFGSGGFKGLASYGTGMIVSKEGHILTVASHLLDTQDLRVHLYDGRRFHAKVVRQQRTASRRLPASWMPPCSRSRKTRSATCRSSTHGGREEAGGAERRHGARLQQPVPDRHARRADVGAARRDRGACPSWKPAAACTRRPTPATSTFSTPSRITRCRRRRTHHPQRRAARRHRQGAPQHPVRNLGQLRGARDRARQIRRGSAAGQLYPEAETRQDRRRRLSRHRPGRQSRSGADARRSSKR